MSDFIIQNQTVIRLTFFLSILLIVGVWELQKPRLILKNSKLIRWVSNLGIVFLNSVLLKIIFPLTATGLAIYAETKGWGVFNIVSIDPTLKVILSILMLDMVIYFQHVMFHAVPLFWQLHQMHHVDLDYDVTTGSRFHPIEIILSMGVKFTFIVLLGVPALAVILFEIILNGAAMFNHGNIYIPPQIDKYLRLFIVTPDMHRIHHSVVVKETHSNFGFNVPWWDRLFGTYIAEPEAGRTQIEIGTPKFRDAKYLGLHWMLILPFIRDKDIK